MAAVAPSLRARLVADGLFVLQIVCGLGFGVSQFMKMLETTQGVSVSWLLLWALFLGINFRLAVQAHQTLPSRITRQTVATYVIWLAMLSINLGLLAWRHDTPWTRNDSLTTALAAAGTLAVLAVGRWHGLGFRDPLVRGWMAVFFKGVPQLTLAWYMAQVGGSGLSAFAVWTGHFTICTRLGQLVFSIREAGWDRARVGSLISEVANEGSWIVATVVWVFVT